VFDDIFETVNSGFAQSLYEDYLRDPSSVPEEWRKLFDNGIKGEEPAQTAAAAPATPPAAPAGQESDAPPRAEQPSGAAGADASAPPGEQIKGPPLRQLQNMEASLEIPTATSFRDMDVSLLWAVRAAFNRQLKQRDLKLSFTHLIGWALVRAAQEVPALTHTLAEQGEDYFRVEPDAVNLGLAVDTVGKRGERRLMVPIVKQADRMSFRDFHEEYERVVTGAREGKLMPDAYMGGTFTLTNPGTIGTVASVPRLMKGQGSIIATGAIREIGGVKVMTMTSTYDHRIIQGAESGEFLQVVDRLLQGEHDFYREIARSMDLDAATLTAAETAVRAGVPVAPKQAASAALLTDGAIPQDMLYHTAAAMSLVRAHRTHGYLAARLNPLGIEPRGDPALNPANLDLTPEVMRHIPADVLRTYVGGETMLDVLPRLREIYCGTIAYEIEHIASHEERVWLRRVIESGEHRRPLSDEEKVALLGELTKVDTLERFLHRAYLGHKRFGIEGLDMLVPMLHHGAPWPAQRAVTHPRRFVRDSARRVRGRPRGGRDARPQGRHRRREVSPRCDRDLRDVARAGDRRHADAQPQPPRGSGPGGRGQRARAPDQPLQAAADVRHPVCHADPDPRRRGVRGAGCGGRDHQPGAARGLLDRRHAAHHRQQPGWLHHEPERGALPCLAAVNLAMMYRKKYRHDAVINLVGYRRHGHNEGDEPRYTQPQMYKLIDEHPTVRELYAGTLVNQKVITGEQAEQMVDEVYSGLTETQTKLKADLERGVEPGEEPQRISGLWVPITEPATAVAPKEFEALNEELLTYPEGFNVNRKLQRVLDRRRTAVTDDSGLDWAHAESLALAALLTEGVPIRMVGQDTVRGTFSQRHLTLFDSETGAPYTPIQHLAGATVPMELHNSPLSEYAALGFEYGYAVAAPKTLVIWEAQFGDFANSAEVIIDQFIIAGLAKWGQTSRLTLLLPHGYEGQGPEHSSARLERYLALGAEGNIRFSNPSTPAQYFHLLRRQARHEEMRPLIVMTPKSLLRLPQATSHVAEFTEGEFHAVLDDPDLPGTRETVTRLVLCSGKVYYDIVGSERRAEAGHVAVGRIELLYPFPEGQVVELIESYPNLEEVLWLQEEPMNMGARKWMVPHLEAVAPDNVAVRYTSRPERSSPAEGYPAAHHAEQQRIVNEGLA
jgi:2-oxoglutarate dehydrogenase E1 component